MTSFIVCLLQIRNQNVESYFCIKKMHPNIHAFFVKEKNENKNIAQKSIDQNIDILSISCKIKIKKKSFRQTKFS